MYISRILHTKFAIVSARIGTNRSHKMVFSSQITQQTYSCLNTEWSLLFA